MDPRFWYGGRTPPSPAQLARDGGADEADLDRLREAMAALQRNCLTLAADSVEARRGQFLGALLDLAASPAQRVQVLKQLGPFRFAKAESPEARKIRLAAALREVSHETSLAEQAGKLADLWRPAPQSFLAALLDHPSEVGRLLARRLGGRDGAPIAIVHDALDGLDGEGRRAFVRAGAVAFQRGGAIHLLGGIAQYLRSCAQARAAALPPLHLLLLHEVVEGLLQETTPLDGLAAHVVSTTLERCLGGRCLPLAVEAFLVEWESRAAPAQVVAPPAPDEAALSWEDCLITHDQLRPEAFVQRTLAEQRQILREMFGDDWNDEDEAALEGMGRAAA